MAMELMHSPPARSKSSMIIVVLSMYTPIRALLVASTSVETRSTLTGVDIWEEGRTNPGGNNRDGGCHPYSQASQIIYWLHI